MFVFERRSESGREQRVSMDLQLSEQPVLSCLRGDRLGRDGGGRVVLHVPTGQLEPGVPDDGGPLQTQQPGLRRQAVHHRRTRRPGKPGPRGEVGGAGARNARWRKADLESYSYLRADER